MQSIGACKNLRELIVILYLTAKKENLPAAMKIFFTISIDAWIGYGPTFGTVSFSRLGLAVQLSMITILGPTATRKAL